MKENKAIVDLIREIKKSLSVLEKIDSFYEDFKQNEFPRTGKNRIAAIVMAEILADYYTCVETLFFRISQFFENSLPKDKWHSELLHKMTLEIEDIRRPVITDKTYGILLEFMKFRHFKRYYFEFDYDWDKLDYLEKKYSELKGLLKNDLNYFLGFLKKIV